jgi:archaellum component FlaC
MWGGHMIERIEELENNIKRLWKMWEHQVKINDLLKSKIERVKYEAETSNS